MSPQLNLLAYFIAINIFALILYWWDKRCAVHGHWRVPETILLFFAAIGGTFGAWRAMIIYRHKTRNSRFRNQFFTIFLLQLFVLGFFIYDSLPPEWIAAVTERIK